ncbi:MAG: prepilin-type N-terminal cleavage/methylation domain-containing protein [Rhodobacteraceae bacterium]|nr:prepilin-type N-terminal cleavage/methylation domain-containing protein [Paracoccaceae bacterium]
MSGICPNQAEIRSSQGFTLLELLVVLAIIGMVAAVAGPRLPSVYDSISFAMKRETLEQGISALPYVAYKRGIEFDLKSSDAEAIDGEITFADLLDVPEGWRIDVDQPIRYMPSGYCSGGALTIHAGRVDVSYDLAAPRCVAEQVK